MPKATARSGTAKASAHRAAPYTKSPPKDSKDKENVDPDAHASKNPNNDQSDYRDIPLDEVKGEVPCYDDASTVRRKLKKLLTDKSTVPGTSKKWSQAAMVGEMQELENRSHPVPYNANATGPTARSLGNFLKKSGRMGAGDSPCYYWGYILLEKLRISKGEKKSKPRLKAEEEYPGGYAREDASKKSVTMPINGPPPPGAWQPMGRGCAGPVAPGPLEPPELCADFTLPGPSPLASNFMIQGPPAPSGAFPGPSSFQPNSMVQRPQVPSSTEIQQF